MQHQERTAPRCNPKSSLQALPSQTNPFCGFLTERLKRNSTWLGSQSRGHRHSNHQLDICFWGKKLKKKQMVCVCGIHVATASRWLSLSGFFFFFYWGINTRSHTAHTPLGIRWGHIWGKVSWVSEQEAEDVVFFNSFLISSWHCPVYFCLCSFCSHNKKKAQLIL